MPALFVVSTETFGGKTAVIAGLTQHFRQDGYTTGYLKPVSTTPRVTEMHLSDVDAQFMQETFDVPGSLDTLVPVKLTASVIEAALRDDGELAAQIVPSFNTVRADVDVLLVEGSGDLCEAALFDLSALDIADLLDLSALVIVRYSDHLTGDRLVLAQRLLGERLVGAIINAVPDSRRDFFVTRVVPVLEQRGIRVLGVLPQDKILRAASVQELADGLNGEIVSGKEHCDALVETLSVGAMGIDQALSQFRRQAHKAVITGGDRTDIQLAALQTSTRCLILTGNIYPNALIVTQAEERGVPIIVSKQSTLETVEAINQFFGRTRFHQPEKLDHLRQIFESNVDFDRLYRVLKLKSPSE